MLVYNPEFFEIINNCNESTRKVIMSKVMNDIREKLAAGDVVNVRLAAYCHSSVQNQTTWYRVVHINDSKVWVINPDTDYVLSISDPKNNVKMVASSPTPAAKEEKYILWNPKSSKTPRVTHNSEQDAVSIAKDMAMRNPGEQFYVCKLLGAAHMPKPVPVTATFEKL